MSSSTFVLSRLTENRFLLATSLVAACGWVIAFAGGCALQALYGAWWVVIYQALLIIGCLLVFTSDTLPQYRFVLLTFLAASIPLLTIQVDYVIQYIKPSIPRDPANAYAAGYIILIIVQYVWVITFGSDPDSYLGQFVCSSLHRPQPQNHEQDNYLQQPTDYMAHEKHLDDATITNDKRLVDAATITVPIEPSTDYREKVEALHSYKANPEDPNELSFEKGEILHVVDRKGNWWQARKANGEIGIIPSNYFTSSPNAP